MSSESDSDEFYDAEDNTPIHGTRKQKRLFKEHTNTELQKAEDEANSNDAKPDQEETKAAFQDPNNLNLQNVSKLLQGGRKKFKELRQKLQTDDEDGQATNLTPPNSQTSSIEGVYAASSRTTHPFRVIEVDAISLQSINSLGRVGRILSGSDNGSVALENAKAPSVSALSNSSHDSESTPSSKDASQYPSTLTLSTMPLDAKIPLPLPLQEPDVIASTKPPANSNGKILVLPVEIEAPEPPVAPPRRKKKAKHSASTQCLAATTVANTFSSHSLASPASTIEYITRELENSLDSKPVVAKSDSTESSKSASLHSRKSLDIRQATKGLFVVKPQDNDMHRAGGSTQEDVQQLKSELLPLDALKTPTSGVRFSASRNSVGHYSLGSNRNSQKHMLRASKERRRSAGDELNFVRAGAEGKPLSDLEILEQVTVLNLDTGERIPLSVAEEKIPQCINPLSLHIMRLTSEYVSSSSMEKEKESDEESVDTRKSDPPSKDENDPEEASGMRKKTAKLKRFLGSTVKKTMHKAKSIAHEVSHARHKEDVVDLVDEVHPEEQYMKLKASNSHKGPYEFEKIQHVQEFTEHEGPIWCMKFSCCGRLLATAGQDKVLRIWVTKDAYQFFQDMRTKYNAKKVSPTPSQESLVSHHSNENVNFESANSEAKQPEEGNKLIFMPKPFCTYTGHTSDLLDVSWSKNYFILSSSMDKTVRLWHISRKECLCCFQHIDFVTAIVFHPRDDRYFLSGSLDGKLRLWNIPDKKVAVWNEVEGTTKLITAANFCQNGKFAVVGSYDGRCIFYTTDDQLKYYTQINVRSTRGKNATGRKISGIEPMPGEDKILVTSNDSRIRLYDLRDLNVSCKYKGYLNVSSQIKASFSHDGKYIVSGSENRDIYIWKTNHDYSKFSSVRRDRNDFWEAIKAHTAVVTCAIFAPNPDGIFKQLENQEKHHADKKDTNEKEQDPMVEQHRKGCGGYVLISADFNGCIKVFINKMKPKHSSLPASAIV